MSATATITTEQRTGEPLLSARGVSRVYTSRRGGRGSAVHALDKVDLDVHVGEVVGLVGESGCGKSTLGRILAQLDRPTEGTVRFRGQDLFSLSGRAGRRHRQDIQFVFQDPFSSLNPRRTIGMSIAEPLVNAGVDGTERRRRVAELMDACGLRPELADRYPHELSGGQRQRVGIARALVMRPSMLVLDEPVSALDVSVQAQVINLLADLRTEFSLSYVFISHDLGIVAHLCDRVVVMYRGTVVETGPVDRIFEAPAHPYTAALLSSVPLADPESEARRQPILLRGEPSDDVPENGCRFAPRCPVARPGCDSSRPALVPVGAAPAAAGGKSASAGALTAAPDEHKVACPYPGELTLSSSPVIS